MKFVKDFIVGDVVSSPEGVGKVTCVIADPRRRYPVEVTYEDAPTLYYTLDGRRNTNHTMASLFHGYGTVENKMVFTPVTEPVYEYQWLLKYKVGVVDTSAFYKTEGEMLDDYSDHEVEFFERLDKYRREAK